ncbi:hypothetical protein HG537_0E02500 [Torulaspora globosa]|uniref:Myb/SANT-like DNA-binding domain-containing protein n=1 Tax=Torulaspora globosa TaxID=48254 RepID=A0A7H9HWP7_9SACH|nr:hypothetical protein HG537_0E02500 [Torulaspora sp. CBS 2947]
MGDISLGVDDLVLLKLMDKYKPHLKPYAYRQDAWFRVLDDYNEKTGNVYRQIRTLKSKFNRMKELCNDESGVDDLELLQKLVGEIDNGAKRRVRRRRRTRLRVSPPQQDAIDRSEEDMEGHISEQDDSAIQPPPLDSITMGFSMGNRNNTSSSPLASEQPPVEPGGSADVLGDVEIYKHLITSLKGILSRKSCLSEVATNQDSITVDKLYTELREFQRAEQQFREQVLHRLDTIIAHLGNRASFPD